MALNGTLWADIWWNRNYFSRLSSWWGSRAPKWSFWESFVQNLKISWFFKICT